MLIPRKVKHRKQHHPRQRGIASGGTSVSFGEYGIQALEHAYITNRQIESARIAINRHIKRGGKVWIYKGDIVGGKREATATVPSGADRPRRERPSGTRPRRSGASGTTATSTDAGRAASGAEDAPAVPDDAPAVVEAAAGTEAAAGASAEAPTENTES